MWRPGTLARSNESDLLVLRGLHVSCFSHIWLFVTVWTVACQAPLSMGFPRPRILKWVPLSSCRGSSWPRNRTCVSYAFCIGRGFFTTSVTWEASLEASFQSVQFSHSVGSNFLWPHRLQHTRLPCLLPTPGACSNSRPSSQWFHPTILSSIVPFSCLQSFPASGPFPMSWLLFSSGHSIGASASASILPMNTQGWFPLGLRVRLLE